MSSRIVELSTTIAEKTKIIDEYFSKNGMETPSFDVSGPTRVHVPSSDGAVYAAHIAVLDATTELNQLLTGPSAMLMSISVSSSDYDLLILAQRSFEDLSETTGLNVVDLRRVLRHAMCNHIFDEPRTGYVVHTAASRLLAENKLMYDFTGIGTEEKFPSAPRVSYPDTKAMMIEVVLNTI
nr:o-methyltransferase gsfb [Quercus suber]